MKVLVHDGIGVRLAARHLNSGRLVWPKDVTGTSTLTREQVDALVLGLPRQPLGHAAIITVLWRASIAACADGAPAPSRLVIIDEHLDTFDPEQLRQALRAAHAEVAPRDELLAHGEREVAFEHTVIDKPTHENAARSSG